MLRKSSLFRCNIYNLKIGFEIRIERVSQRQKIRYIGRKCVWGRENIRGSIFYLEKPIDSSFPKIIESLRLSVGKFCQAVMRAKFLNLLV